MLLVINSLGELYSVVWTNTAISFKGHKYAHENFIQIASGKTTVEQTDSDSKFMVVQINNNIKRTNKTTYVFPTKCCFTAFTEYVGHSVQTC